MALAACGDCWPWAFSPTANNEVYGVACLLDMAKCVTDQGPVNPFALLMPQVISMAVVLAWALGTGFLMFFVLKVTMGVRLSAEEEEMGIDASEHGILAYPEG